MMVRREDGANWGMLLLGLLLGVVMAIAAISGLNN